MIWVPPAGPMSWGLEAVEGHLAADSLGPSLESGWGVLGVDLRWFWWALPAAFPWQACTLPTSPAHLLMFFFKSALS